MLRAMKGFKGKIAVVTGAAQGIGYSPGSRGNYVSVDDIAADVRAKFDGGPVDIIM